MRRSQTSVRSLRANKAGSNAWAGDHTHLPQSLNPAMVVLTGAALLAACHSPIQSELDETQANEIIAALRQEGIAARKQRGRTTGGGGVDFEVTVPAHAQTRALSIVATEQLPRRATPGMRELFASSALVPSRMEETVRYSAALAGELARTLEANDGVIDARVHLALVPPEPRLLDAAVPSPRASVSLRLEPQGRALSDSAVQALVAGSIQGMAPSQVAVIRTSAARHRKTGPRYVAVGPLQVSPTSAVTARWILGGSFLLNILLAAVLVVVSLGRRRRAEAEHAE